MKRLLFPLAFVAVLAGCQSGDDGIDNNAVTRAQAPLVAAAK